MLHYKEVVGTYWREHSLVHKSSSSPPPLSVVGGVCHYMLHGGVTSTWSSPARRGLLVVCLVYFPLTVTSSMVGK